MVIQEVNEQDLSKMLNDAGIVANANTLYTRNSIENAIQRRSGFRAFIKCDTNLANTHAFV